MSDNLDYDDIRRRVEKRVNKRKELYIHMGVFVFGNVVVSSLWLLMRSPFVMIALDTPLYDVFRLFTQLPVPLLLLCAWGIGVMAHSLAVYFETGALDKMHEREMTREIEREKQRPYLNEKPKREALTLSDDGELVPISEQQKKNPIRSIHRADSDL